MPALNAKKTSGLIFLIFFVLTPVFASPGTRAVVDISEQKLYLFERDKLLKVYPVSTSKYGAGNRQNSGQTPLGRHSVAKKIGAGAPLNAIFENRVNTGRVFDGRAGSAGDDLITTRILWLEGLEPGVNKGRRVDSFHRLIYIHGTAEEALIGRPASHGCVRMKNEDVLDLFNRLDLQSEVFIQL